MHRDELKTAGWPGESLMNASGRARVYVALSTLRKLGFDSVLESTGEGYRFVATTSVAPLT